MNESAIDAMAGPLRELRLRFEELTEPYRPALWRYCLRLTGNVWDAEDLVQETLAKAFARITLFWQAINPRTYLFRVASNTWIDTTRRATHALEDLDETGGLPDNTAAAPGETWAAMETLVGTLPPRQRVVLLLIDVFDFKPTEVAPMVGITEGAVRATLYRARETLRKAHTEALAGAQPQDTKRATPQLVSRFVDAFNRRDAAALAALLSPEVSMGIVGLVQQEGHEAAGALLASWASNPLPTRAEAGYLDGRHVIYVFIETPERGRALARLMWLDDGSRLGEAENGTQDEKVVRWHCYFFNAELLEHAAAQLGVSWQRRTATADTFEQIARMCRPANSVPATPSASTGRGGQQ